MVGVGIGTRHPVSNQRHHTNNDEMEMYDACVLMLAQTQKFDRKNIGCTIKCSWRGNAIYPLNVVTLDSEDINMPKQIISHELEELVTGLLMKPYILGALDSPNKHQALMPDIGGNVVEHYVGNIIGSI